MEGKWRPAPGPVLPLGFQPGRRPFVGGWAVRPAGRRPGELQRPDLRLAAAPDAARHAAHRSCLAVAAASRSLDARATDFQAEAAGLRPADDRTGGARS